LGGGLVCQRDCLLRIFRRACRSLPIHIDIVPLVDHISAIVINRRLIGRVLHRINRQESSGRGKSGSAPPPPGITGRVTSSVPATISPPVIVKIVVEIVLDIVIYFSRPVVPKIIYVTPVVVPLLAVKSVPHVFVFPEIVDIAPVFAAVRAEVGKPTLIVARPFIPILLAIGDGLISLG